MCVCVCVCVCERERERVCVCVSGGQSTQIKYLSKSTDAYNKILLH